jgi:hypothetical protein
MGDGSSIAHVEDVPQAVFRALVNEHGHEQDKKHVGYAVSQSLTELMHYLDPSQVIRVKAHAKSKDDDETFKGISPEGAAAYCVDVTECLTTEIKMNYDYDRYGRFPWSQIKDFLEMETTPVDDLTVRSMTLRLESDRIRDELRKVLTDMGLSDTDYLRNPFFFTLESRQAKDEERDYVKKHNDEEFLKRVGYRVLELQSMYSLRAQQGKKDPLARTKSGDVYPRDFEDMAFNYNDKTSQNFGALYSQFVINKLKQPFSSNLVNKTRKIWTSDGQWKRESETDVDDITEEAAS